MSWDIYIQDLPDVPSMRDVPDDFRPASIGLKIDILEKIRKEVPFADEQDDWLFVRGQGIDLSIQFQMETRTEVRYLLVHVHGGEQSANCVAAIVSGLGLRAVDTLTGEFFDSASLDENT